MSRSRRRSPVSARFRSGVTSSLCTATLLAVLPSVASAHIALRDPEARWDPNYNKEGPCGMAGGAAGPAQTTYEVGQTVTVEWDETVDHTSHYRVALAMADGELVDPTDFDAFYVAENVLLDDIEDPDVYSHSVDVQLPADFLCDACVLQLIQVMHDAAPWGPDGGSDLYYQCADIRIVPVGQGTTSGDTADPDTGGGSSGDVTDTAGTATTATTATASDSATGASASATAGGSESGGGSSDGSAGTDEGEGGCACDVDSGRASPLLWLGALGLVAARRRRQPSRAT